MTRRDWIVAGISALVTTVVLLLLGTLQQQQGQDSVGAPRSSFQVDTGAPRTPEEPPIIEGDEYEDDGSSGESSDDQDNGGDEQDEYGEPEDAPPLADAPPAGTGPVPDGRTVTCPAATTEVSSTEELEAALSSAAPGDVIDLADNTYAGQFTATTSGTAEQPIFLCGSRDAILDGGDVEDGYVMHLDGASHWRLVGFSVTNGQKGVMADGVTGAVIQDLSVSMIGDEAIHLRDNSTQNAVINNEISTTGLRRDKYGEGVYVGSAVSNWCTYSNCRADRSDFNLVKDNDFEATSSEAIDAKEGTTGGVITGNTFDGSQITGADSWVDVKGNNWLIVDNVGTSSPIDGFQTHQILTGWGDHNVFRSNVATVNASGSAISSWPPESNVVECNNEFSGAEEGLSNITCSS